MEQFVQAAAAAAALATSPGAEGLGKYDSFPAPLYATDRHGALTYFNRACVEFAGREPLVGHDRYCVTWKLRSSDGAALPHDQSATAVALRERRANCGVEAWAERPDGGKSAFRPFAAPAVDRDGQLVGAVTLLVPTDGESRRRLIAMAEKCRRLARWVDDQPASESLRQMAIECDRQAAVLHIG